MVKFIDPDIAQTATASVFGIILFQSVNILIGDKIATFKLWFVVIGIAGIIFAKRITKNHRLIDIIKLLSAILLFIGLSPYILPYIQKQTYLAIVIAALAIYFAEQIGKTISGGTEKITEIIK